MPATELHPLLAVLVGWAVAALASLGGLSGAFLLLPFQVSLLGLAGPAVTATNHLYNVVAIPAGAWRYAREGRLLAPLALVILGGSVPGVVLGALARTHLLAEERAFRAFVGLTLLAIGASGLARRRGSGKCEAGTRDGAPRATRFDLRRFEFTFEGEAHGASVPALALLSLAVGVVGGAYGIGGGALIAPLLVSVWRLPVHALGGATLLATCGTSLFAVLLFAGLGEPLGVPAVAPHWALGLSLGVGGMLGTYTGARLQRRVPARAIERGLCIVVVAVGAAYLLGAP